MAEQLADKTWVLKEAKDLALPKNQASKPSIRFSNSAIAGNTYCNTLSATYTMGNKNEITFSNMMATERACEDQDINAIDIQYLKKLESISAWAIKEGNLILLINGEAALIYTPEIRK